MRFDLRTRLSTKPAYTTPYDGPGAPLRATGGLLFPYTANITTSHSVDYSSYDIVHQNYQQNAYAKTSNPQIQVTGQFISQTPNEVEYTLGVMHFLPSSIQNALGPSDPLRGTPPPVLEFSSYGAQNFQNIPVLVQSFNFVYEDGVDYVETGDGYNQIPVTMVISVDLIPQYSPAKQNNFNLREFANGRLYERGYI